MLSCAHLPTTRDVLLRLEHEIYQMTDEHIGYCCEDEPDAIELIDWEKTYALYRQLHGLCLAEVRDVLELSFHVTRSDVVSALRRFHESYGLGIWPHFELLEENTYLPILYEAASEHELFLPDDLASLIEDFTGSNAELQVIQAPYIGYPWEHE